MIDDESAHASFISLLIVEKVVLIEADTGNETLSPHQVYSAVIGRAHLACSYTGKVNVYSHSRHRSTLILTNIIWSVADEGIRAKIVGRSVFKYLGCHNQKILQAARDRPRGDIDVTEDFPRIQTRKTKMAALQSCLENPFLTEEGKLKIMAQKIQRGM